MNIVKALGAQAALALAALALTCGAGIGAAHAQGYPDKPVKIVVPYAPGGGTDVFARIVAGRMGKELGQTVIIENRPGAGTIIGADAVARAAPDGYTVLLGDNGTYSVNPSLYKKLPYDPAKDFAPVTLTARYPLALVVHSSVPANTVQEFIRMVAAKPGQWNFASPGAGSPHHLAMEMFMQRTNLKMVHVPYKGNGPAVQDLIAGQVPAMFLDLVSITQYLKSGKIKVLGMATAKRVASLPDVPTISEAGVADFEAVAWQGFSVPRGTPQPIISKLNAAYAATTKDPEVKKKLDDLVVELTPSTPEAMKAHVEAETDKWAKIIRAAHITLD